MHTLRVVLLVCGLAGCLSTLPKNSPDQKALDAVKSAWTLSNLPDFDDCLKYVEVRRYKTRAPFEEECAGLSPGLVSNIEKVKGCTTYALKGVMGTKYTVINLAPEHANDMGLVQHEALHALIGCTMQRGPRDPWDAGHTEPRIWQAAGGVNSVQYKATQSQTVNLN